MIRLHERIRSEPASRRATHRPLPPSTDLVAETQVELPESHACWWGRRGTDISATSSRGSPMAAGHGVAIAAARPRRGLAHTALR